MFDKKNYRLIKLKSGEEIITKVMGKTSKNELIVERPMIFRSIVMQDPFGAPREVKILKDWLENTDSIKTKVPKDFIVSILLPNEKSYVLYEEQKERDDIGPMINNSKNNVLQSFIDDIINKKIDQDSMTDDVADSILESIYEKQNSFPPKEEEEIKEEHNMISMTLFFPPEALIALVDANLIDREDFMEMMDHLNNNLPQKSDKSHPNYGNRLQDWSKDIKDYLDDSDGHELI